MTGWPPRTHVGAYTLGDEAWCGSLGHRRHHR
jgi:hypothetical protein